MTSFVTSHRWIFITRRANFIVLVTDEISLLNFYELKNGGFSFCQTTNRVPLVNFFLFCYERDFMMSLSDDKQADIIDAFNTTSRYLEGILNIDNVYFDNIVNQIYT